MKNLISTLSLIALFVIGCKAQKPVVTLNKSQIEISHSTYLIRKLDGKYTEIINSSNKFIDVKPVAPNLPPDVSIVRNIKLDKNTIIKICANAIPLSTLEKSPKGIGDWLSIRLKVNSEGYPEDVEFLIKKSSLLTANQLQQIEQGIKHGNFKVTILNGIERLFKGMNYFDVDISVYYTDMLKVKQAH